MFVLIILSVLAGILLSLFGKKLAAFIRRRKHDSGTAFPTPSPESYPWALPVHIHSAREMMPACNLFANRLMAYPPGLLAFDPEAPLEAMNHVRISLPASFPGIMGFSIHPHVPPLRNDRHTHSFTVPDNMRLEHLARLFRSLDYQKSLIDYAAGRLSAQAYSAALVQRVQAFDASTYDRIASAGDIIGLKYCFDELSEIAGILRRPYLATAGGLLQSYKKAGKENGEETLITATVAEIATELMESVELFLRQELSMYSADEEEEQKICSMLHALAAMAQERRAEWEQAQASGEDLC